MTKTHYEMRKEANARYLATQDDIRVRAPKGTKDRWRAAADAGGYDSLQRFIIAAVEAAVAAQNAPKEDQSMNGSMIQHSAWIIKKLPNVGPYDSEIAICARCKFESKQSADVREQGLCGTKYYAIMTKFCPNCGARMHDVE